MLMVISTVGNGSMVKSKEEVYKFIRIRVNSMMESGRMISLMVRGKCSILMDLNIRANSKMVSKMV